MASVEAVNVVRQVRDGRWGRTAIDKRPVDGLVQVGELGLAGDQQLTGGHGGRDRAVYAYASEDAVWWAEELGRETPAGLFGENLRTVGLPVGDAQIGERWRIRDVVLEVRLPRTPCENLSLRLGIERFHRRFASTGRVGAMLKVLEPGELRAGDEIEIVFRPDHGLTITDLAVGAPPARAQRLLDSGLPLAPTVRAKLRRTVHRAAAS